jgi:ABC-type Fe3+-hydroxamate transport system substrate-binding protein
MHEAEKFGTAPVTLWHGDTRTFADMAQHIEQLGALLGYEAAATALSAQIAQQCQAPSATSSQQHVAPTVLFEYCVCTQYDPDPERRVSHAAQTVLVGGHLAPELIQLSGGQPLLVQPGDAARWVTLAEIQAAQPEMILQYDCHGCPTALRQPISTRSGWATLPAVARQAVYPLSANISDPNLGFPVALKELRDIFRASAPRP